MRALRGRRGAGWAPRDGCVPLVQGTGRCHVPSTLQLMRPEPCRGERANRIGGRRLGWRAMNLGLEGKVALVTASSKGLGQGTALALSAEGAKVVICARGEDALRATERAMPGEVLAIVSDVTEPAQPQRLVDAAVEGFGGF